MEVALEPSGGEGLEEFPGACQKKSLGCPDVTVGRNMNVKGKSSEVSGREEKSWREILCHLRGYVYQHGQNVGRIMDRNEECVTGNWRKDDPSCKVVKNLAELCSHVLCMVTLASNKIGYFAEEIPKQDVEEVIWFAYRKT